MMPHSTLALISASGILSDWAPFRAGSLTIVPTLRRALGGLDAAAACYDALGVRVAFFTTGRFTLVDLARELAALGHESRVYSLVPPLRTRRFGLPSHCNRWLGAHVAPLYAAYRLTQGTPAAHATAHALTTALDHIAARVIESCDVFIAMSGIGVRSLDAVRRRHGAQVFLERSSRHILSQRAILEAIPGTNHPVPDWAVDRELAGYGLADVVTVPSRHVAESFVERGFPAHKLFLNPFGTSFETFHPTVSPAGPPTILMTGTWSLRKGCDVLVEAWRRMPPGTRLLHVGTVGDAPLPRDPGFEHVDAVPQSELPRYYEQAHVFALASREEGLAVVQIQALACGLQLVCTTRTGGEDLRDFCATPNAIHLAPPDDAERLAFALASALRQAPAAGQLRDVLGDHREDTSWRAYAKRYEARMLEQLRSR